MNGKSIELTGMDVSNLKYLLQCAHVTEDKATCEMAQRLLSEIKHLEGRPFKNGLSFKQSEPLLGLATTGELIKELAARAELGNYANYRTVDED